MEKDSWSISTGRSPLAAVRKTKKGAALKRWFKEEWKDEKGNVCGSEENKNTKKLYDFVSRREFDEYGNIINKVCRYDGSLYPIEEFGNDKKSIDGYSSRCKKNSGKRNRR